MINTLINILIEYLKDRCNEGDVTEYLSEIYK